MAELSPAKKIRKQVKGFLCDVSPVKDLYFDAVLQHDDGNSKVVVFRPEDHTHFDSAEKTRSLVTLDDVVVQPSAESSGNMDVFFTHSSKIKLSCARNLGEAFNSSSSAGARAVQLSELLNMHTKPTRVDINAKIIHGVQKKNLAVYDGQKLPRTEYTIADTTGCTSLTVWCEHSITVGEWYNITNISVREIRGKTSLSTTKDTRIVSIPSQGTAATAQVPTETIKCDIIGANIQHLLNCPRKHKLKSLTLSSPTLFCIPCKTYYKSAAIIMNLSGHLELKPEMGNVMKAKIEDEVIRSVVTVNPTASLKDIIKSFIDLPAMQITIHKNIIVKMEHAPQMTEIKPEDQLEPVEEFYSPPDHGVLFSSQIRKRKSPD